LEGYTYKARLSSAAAAGSSGYSIAGLPAGRLYRRARQRAGLVGEPGEQTRHRNVLLAAEI
jgi:hypothetical protein